MKLVSICIPSHNYHIYTQRLIESVLWQTYQNFELVIVDDRSDKETVDILKKYENNPKVRITFKDKNEGMVKTLCQAFDLAKGDYIMGMNADDHLMPKALELMSKYLDEHPEKGMVYSDFYLVDRDTGKPIEHYKKYPVDKDMLLEKNHLGIWCAMWRKECFDKAGYPEFELCCDWDLWLKISEHYEIGHIAEPLVCWWDDGTSYFYKSLKASEKQAEECRQKAIQRRSAKK
jgi:glycosyltransferase involved in cell wall biosynthesis